MCHSRGRRKLQESSKLLSLGTGPLNLCCLCLCADLWGELVNRETAHSNREGNSSLLFYIFLRIFWQVSSCRFPSLVFHLECCLVASCAAIYVFCSFLLLRSSSLSFLSCPFDSPLFWSFPTRSSPFHPPQTKHEIKGE